MSYSQSASIANLATALAAFHAECPKVYKTEKNPFYSSKYADLATILEVVDPVLAKNGLAVVQVPVGKAGLVTTLVHASGEWISAQSEMAPAESVLWTEKDSQGNVVATARGVTPQTLGSAITYQRRYSLGAILSLNIDNDDDGNKASGLGDKPEAKPASKGKPESKPANKSEQQAKVEPLPQAKVSEMIEKISTGTNFVAMETALTGYGSAGRISKALWTDLATLLLEKWIEKAEGPSVMEAAGRIPIYFSRGLLSVDAHARLQESVSLKISDMQQGSSEGDK